MFIIQTNRTAIDFQSFMYEVINQSWKGFKEKIKNGNHYLTDTSLMFDQSKIKLDGLKVVKCNIDDEKHFEVVFNNNVISSYMMTTNCDIYKLCNK